MTRSNSALVRALDVALSISKRLSDTGRALDDLVEGVALGALSDDDLHALTTARYARSRSHRRELFDWEQAWFERDLPPPPARLLVGGAGHGRELAWLARRGYQLVGFDPACPGDSVHELGYEDFIAPTSRARAAALDTIRASAPYDAVIFGWGSYTHLASHELRIEVLRAMHELSDGPLLVSYWRITNGPARAHGRAARLGGLIARAFGVAQAERHGDRVVAHAGYGHSFTDEELISLAREAGYRACVHRDGYPHATLFSDGPIPSRRLDRPTTTTVIPTRGLSMLPTIYPRDRLHVRPPAPGDLRPGALVAFPGRDGVICHRIVAAEQRENGLWLQVRGDAQAASEWVHARAIAFVVVEVDGRLGRWNVHGPRGYATTRLALARAPLLSHLRLATARVIARTARRWQLQRTTSASADFI